LKIAIDLNRALTAEDARDLDAILVSVVDGWHTWAAPSASDESLAPYFASRTDKRELVEKSLTSTAYDHMPRKTLSVESDLVGGNAMSLSEASIYLRQRLKILVENSISDSEFLIRGFRVTNPLLADKLSEPNPPAEFLHAGGKSEAVNIISARSLGARMRGVQDRLVVIVDSDAKYPGHVDSVTNAVSQVCSAESVKFAILKKRAIENYASDRMIDDYVQASPEAKDAGIFVKSLTRVQRDHYPMKKSFSAGAVLTQQETALYSDVGDAAVVKNRLSNAMKHFLANMTEFTRDDLASRFAVDEFSELADLIEEEL